MEPIKQPTTASGLLYKGLFFCTLPLLSGTTLLAQNSGTGAGKITVGEIVMYVAIIIAVIAVAWFFSSRQTDRIDQEHKEHSHHIPKKHYDHPNDPHFKKLRKKTS